MNRKALVIGINNYPGNELHGCINDAEEVASLLSKNYDNSNNFDVVTKYDVKTKDELKKFIKTLFSNDDDIALLYFSGHGFSDDSDEYICTPDFTKYSPGMALKDILIQATKSNCKNRIIILDSCYSGGMGKCSLLGSTEAISSGMTILSASRSDECSVESNNRGVFTTLLCEALKGGAADLFGQITPGAIYAYIDKALGSWEQRPLFKTNVQQFVNLRNTEPPIKLADLQQIDKLFNESTIELPLDPSFECTNNPESKPELIEPYTNEKNVAILKLLQRYERVGLVEPVGEIHMYDAAMHSKSCKLTPLGQYYWMLSNKNRF